MDENSKIVIFIVCIIMAALLSIVGILMHVFDLSCMFDKPSWVKTDEGKGLYIIKACSVIKVAEDTPENRRKFSKGLGNFFIVFSIAWVVLMFFLLFA